MKRRMCFSLRGAILSGVLSRSPLIVKQLFWDVSATHDLLSACKRNSYNIHSSNVATRTSLSCAGVGDM